MKADLSAYITFEGRAREALEHYQTALGGKVLIETFRKWEIPTAPGHENDVVYGVLRTDDGFVLRVKDRASDEEPVEQGTAWALCLNGEEVERLTACWNALAEGATIIEPLQEMPWGDLNGALIDVFGIRWSVNIGSSE